MNNDEFDPLEKLSLLSAHAIDLRHIPSDSQRITASDIAAKLAKVSRGASLLGRVKIAGEIHLCPALLRQLRTEVVQRHIPWPTNKKTRLPILAETALLEVIDPKVCKKCDGVSQLPEIGQDGQTTGKIQVCDRCGGGKYSWTDHLRAKNCGIHHEEWKRTWTRVYVQIITIPWAWESEVREALKT